MERIINVKRENKNPKRYDYSKEPPREALKPTKISTLRCQRILPFCTKLSPC